MNTWQSIPTKSEIDALTTRIAALEQQLAAMQADIAAAKGEPEKVVGKARCVEHGESWNVVTGGLFYRVFFDRWDCLTWADERRGEFASRDIAEAVAAALNARGVKP